MGVEVGKWGKGRGRFLLPVSQFKEFKRKFPMTVFGVRFQKEELPRARLTDVSSSTA